MRTDAHLGERDPEGLDPCPSPILTKLCPLPYNWQKKSVELKSLLNHENYFVKTEFMFVLCLHNCFIILHLLCAFVKVSLTLNFFLNFSKRVS